jgi:protein-disulfide isomerase
MLLRLAGCCTAVTTALLVSGVSAFGPNRVGSAHTPDAVEITIEGAPFKGRGDAPVVIVEFSDFQCRFCGRHARQTLPLIEARYVETGSVKYVFKHLPRQNARRIHQAAECAADRGAFWPVHAALFNRVDRTEDPASVIARTLGMPLPQVQRCAAEARHVARVEEDLEAGIKAGITGTPAFFIGRQTAGASRVRVQKVITGAKPFAVFQPVLDAMVKTGTHAVR